MYSTQPPKYRIPEESRLVRHLATAAAIIGPTAHYRAQEKDCPCSYVVMGTPQCDVTLQMLRGHPLSVATVESFKHDLIIAISTLLYPNYRYD